MAEKLCGTCRYLRWNVKAECLGHDSRWCSLTHQNRCIWWPRCTKYERSLINTVRTLFWFVREFL